MASGFLGKRILITGAGQGIGKALCLRMCDKKAEVVALDKNKKQLDDLVNEVPKGQSIVQVHFDLNQSEIGSEMFEKKLSPLAPFHYLVNNAGVLINDEDFFGIKSVSFDHIFNVNLRSPLFLTQFVARSMVSNGIKGSVVNMSSQASKLYFPMQCAYSTSKAALDSLSKSVAVELSRHGIRVNSVNPTVVNNTIMGAHACCTPDRHKRFLDEIPLGHFAEVDDVVDAVMFLLSDQSRMITGHCLPVDGGATI